MEANELRIGNYVSYYVDGEIIYDKIKSIYFDDKEQVYRCELQSGRYSAFHTSVKSFKPITITEELLVKCCFDKGRYGDFAFGGNGKYFKHLELYEEVYGSGEYSVRNRHNAGLYISSVKSLHQLQNLHFALTGEELEVQL